MVSTVSPAIPLSQVRITDSFWSSYMELVRTTVIPYQYEALHDRIPDTAPSYAIRNFRIAAGLEDGTFGGMVFQDSDVAKWLEAVGYSLASYPDANLERLADEIIDLICQAQAEDGYINTYYTIKEPGSRWTNLHECHELYCAGHMIEAAVAYYQGTGKRKLLDAMCRFADHIDTVFGPEEGKIRGYDGHQEIELALVKLYQATGNETYLRLSQYFIDERGKSPSFFVEEWEKRGRTSHWTGGKGGRPHLEYNQAHVPVREQQVAVGHAVRAVYMYTAMADLARLSQDQGLLDACRRLWANIASKQMYITGGIGSTHHGEAFTFDYDLPNDTVYAETCASIGLVFFAQRMLQIEAKSEYADVMERALYNLIIGSMQQDGKHYFYVNPLEVWPEASAKNPGKHHVKAQRQGWFGCACCPPNLARLLTSLGQYVYTADEDTIYAHLYIGSELSVRLGGDSVLVRQHSELPWQGNVTLQISLSGAKRFTLALRVPDWCAKGASLVINGEAFPLDGRLKDGYVRIERIWSDSDTVEWTLPMKPVWMRANPEIRANAGRAAIQRGPLVYCLEEADHGKPLAALSVSMSSELIERHIPDLFGGIVAIETEGWKDAADGWADQAYRPAESVSSREQVRIRAVPYYLWGNRGAGEMSVWVRAKE
ncbi:glycoside hydrolase family 127 protein [Paenibacillus thermotolerans]|uniref:glycoside hydrolase family 127 protein n=1 Tax=Paenibacillus thermotolerans TaxID=3027807 RepID=UPI0023674C17|nr:MULTISPECIES: beta-L-arabinofuranosidase domain-containing protein [unclassified Paenibacillus]